MTKPRIIAFYLPQYHPIKENDEWWGKGFTDWINVAKARPRFSGHHQPHIPADLGFYDLRLNETRIAQAELANKYGISGFCYYHYWFNGKMLLEKPFDEVLESKQPDFPFCLCWANENWTRRWDGLESEILIEQKYEDYSPEEHMDWLSVAFSDTRYICINNRPLLLIYKADNIPNISDKIQKWRKKAAENGFREIHLSAVKSIHNKISDDEMLSLGFDSVVDFVPNNIVTKYRSKSSLPKYFINRIINKILSIINPNKKSNILPVTEVFSYTKFAKELMRKPSIQKTFACVMPSWDSSARKKYSRVIQNNNPDIYQEWLSISLEKVKENADDEKIVFINAWNEWAEGCHLEPDLKNGRKFLEATLQAVNKYLE